MKIGLDFSKIPKSIINSIETPHSHEGKNNKPLWIVWFIEYDNKNTPYYPAIDSIADSENSAKYHVASLLRLEYNQEPRQNIYCWVERVPANHRFGSSLEENIIKVNREIKNAQMRQFR